MTLLAFQLFALVYCFILPGLLFALGGEHKKPVPIVIAESFTFAILAVPMTCFCVAWLLGTNINRVLVLGVATAYNVGALLRMLVQRKKSCERLNS